MPAKKKGKRTVKKPEKNKSDNISTGADELDVKYRRSVLDVAVLKDQLALQSEMLQKAQSTSTDLKGRIRDMDQRLREEKTDRKDVSSDQSRQYRTMQAELSSRVQRLEGENAQLGGQLASCQEQLRTERTERHLVEREKDATIAELRTRLDRMETDYEKILHDTLDDLTSQLSAARQGWENRGSRLHRDHEELLSHFNLSTLDI